MINAATVMQRPVSQVSKAALTSGPIHLLYTHKYTNSLTYMEIQDVK